MPQAGLPGDAQALRGQLGGDKLKAGGGLARRIIVAALLLVALLLAVVVLIPSLRNQYVVPLLAPVTDRLPLSTQGDGPANGANGGDPQVAAQPAALPADPMPTYTPTPLPHPAGALNFDIATAPQGEAPRWQIAYPDEAQGPGMGCAFLSFWLSGPDAQRFDLLDDLAVHLAIQDGEFLLESYGPTRLGDLRSLGEPRYYEIPGGPPECQNHRFAQARQYAGLEFRLSLQAGEEIIRLNRSAPVAGSLAFATVTPTFTPVPPTATPFPQVRISQAVNVRAGPDTGHPSVGTAQSGGVYRVQATTPQRDWFRIEFGGQVGWVFGGLVTPLGVDGVPVIASLPPTPPPTETPTPVPPTPTATPTPAPYFPFLLVSNGVCQPNAAMTYFNGRVLHQDGTPFNGACVHVSYEGPRNTKCTGCEGAPPGEWGFAPFGNLPGKPGTTVRIYVAPCPDDGIPFGGQNPETGFGPLVAVSQVWTYTVGESVQCTGITFQDNPRPTPENGNGN